MDRLHTKYTDVRSQNGNRLSAPATAAAVYEYAEENGWTFWVDLNSDILDGMELAELMKTNVSLRLIEEALRVEHGWKF